MALTDLQIRWVRHMAGKLSLPELARRLRQPADVLAAVLGVDPAVLEPPEPKIAVNDSPSSIAITLDLAPAQEPEVPQGAAAVAISPAPFLEQAPAAHEEPIADTIPQVIEVPTTPTAPTQQKRLTGVSLTPGWHMVDGARVLVEDGPRTSDGAVFYPLAPGGHWIDNTIVHVHNPAAGFSIRLGPG